MFRRIDLTKLRNFSRTMIGSYERLSVLGKVTEVSDYQGQSEEFMQIGRRVLLPREFFSPEDNYVNDTLAGEFAHSVVVAEQKYLINEVDKLAAETSTNLFRLEGFSYEAILDASRLMTSGVTDIYMPIDAPYYKEVHQWLSSGTAAFQSTQGVGLSIRLAHGNANVHWSSSVMPLRDIYLINRHNTMVTRKRFEDISVPRSMGEVQHSFQPRSYLRLDYARAQDQSNFDFYFRSVINLRIAPSGVLKLALPIQNR